MPKDNKTRALKNQSKAFHPNSRRASQMSRKAQRLLKVEKIKNRKNNKSSSLVTKLTWFRDNLDDSKTFYSKEEVNELIEQYLHRLDNQLDTILESQDKSGHLSSHYRTQHAAKEDSIRNIITKERQLFDTSGIEIPDLTNGNVYKTFLEWTGEVGYIPKLKMKKFSSNL